MFEDFKLEIELIHQNAKFPTRGTVDSSGLDFYTPVDVIIEPNSDVLIPLGLKMRFSKGYSLIFKEKSGIATKKKLDLGACVVDSDYRNEVMVHLVNNSNEIQEFKVGNKIVQAIVVPIWLGLPEVVSNIDENETTRKGGFSSTGI